MSQHRPYCRWCQSRPGGCLHCPPYEPEIEERSRIAIETHELEDGIACVENIVITRVYRVPPLHPDRTPCDPDPLIARLLLTARSAEERGVAVVVYCPMFARWQRQFLRGRATRKRTVKRRVYD